MRRVGGWDAWNVTEDIDLGYRLARFGFAVGALDSDTYEEAPLTLGRWMPQRTRWLKGWMATLIVHAREPRRLLREPGARGALSVAASLLGTALSCLLGPPLLLLAAAEAWTGTLFRPETPVWWLFVGASAALLAGGVAAAAWLALLPLHFLLVFAAAWLSDLAERHHGGFRTANHKPPPRLAAGFPPDRLAVCWICFPKGVDGRARERGLEQIAIRWGHLIA